MINLFFNILNIVIIGGLALYVFKKFFLSNLKVAQEEQQAVMNGLERQRERILRDQKEAYRLGQEQERTCLELKDKIQLWNDRTNSLERDIQKQKDAHREALRHKVHRQSEQFALDQVKIQITNEVTQRLEDESRSFYQDNHNARSFFKHMMAQIEKRNAKA